MRKCTHVMSNHNNKIRLKNFNVLFVNIGKNLHSQLGYQKGQSNQEKTHKSMRLMVGKWELIFQFQCPLASFSITGSRASFGGDLNLLWDAGVHFFTEIKTVTSQCKDSDLQGVAMAFPTSQKVWGMRSWAVQFYNIWPGLLAARQSCDAITKTASQKSGTKTNAQVRWWRMKASSASIGTVQDKTR